MVSGWGKLVVLVLKLERCIGSSVETFKMYVCTCRIRQNHIQLQSKSEEYLAAIILNRWLFVCASKKNLSFQTCGFTSYVNYLSEQRSNSKDDCF